jgi:hypothetical protein
MYFDSLDYPSLTFRGWLVAGKRRSRWLDPGSMEPPHNMALRGEKFIIEHSTDKGILNLMERLSKYRCHQEVPKCIK